MAISGTLMAAAPDDPAVVDAVLNLLQEHPAMKMGIMTLIALAHNNTRAMAFLGAGLSDPDSNVRGTAVQAIGSQPPETIRRYAPQLRTIAADPSEQTLTRDSASRALKQIQYH